MNSSLLNNRSLRITEVHQRLSAILFPLEQLRIEVRKRRTIFYISLLITLVAIVLYLYFYTHYFLYGWIFVIFMSVVFGFFYYFYVSKKSRQLATDFNQKVVPIIIEEFFPDSKYYPDHHVSMTEYWNSNLFRNGVDRYDGNRMFEGTFGKTDIQFSHLHTEYKTESRGKNGSTNTAWHTIFRGIFMIANSNKAFNGQTYVLPDTAERLFGFIGKWFQEKLGSRGRGELVYMESPDFEKKFVVYSTDPVEARYLLTPNMQHYFVQLSDHIGGEDIHASFIDGRLYLALSGHFELFSFWMRKSLLDPETMRHYCQNLCDILSIIEILDLNTRIWGK